MSKLSFRTRRFIVTLVAMVSAFCCANYFLKWHIFGGADKYVLIGCIVFLFVVISHWFPSTDEFEAHRKKKAEQPK